MLLSTPAFGVDPIPPFAKKQKSLRIEKLSNSRTRYCVESDPEKAYLWQTTEDLTRPWKFIPTIQRGTGGEIFTDVQNQDGGFAFIRAVEVTSSSEDLETTDFDNDGFTNGEELLIMGTSPILHFSDEVSADLSIIDDNDSDGFSDVWEALVVGRLGNGDYQNTEDINEANARYLGDLLHLRPITPPIRAERSPTRG